MWKRLALAGLLALAASPAVAASCGLTTGYPFKDSTFTPQNFAATILNLSDANNPCRVVPWELLVDQAGTPYSGSYGFPVTIVGTLPLPAGAATATAQATQATALATIDADVKATQPRSIASNAPSISVAGSLSASGSAVALAVDGMNTGLVQIGTGAWTGTVVFEASADGGTTWIAVNMIPYAGGVSTGSATAGGLWEMAVGGLTNLRVRASTAIGVAPAAIVVRATNGLKSMRVGNPAANPLTVTDPSNAAFATATAMTVGTSVAAGRSVGVNATTAGTIVLTLSGGGTLTLPIALGWQTFPFAATAFAFGSGGAGAVYNLN